MSTLARELPVDSHSSGDEVAMILKRFYDPKLAQASYLVGCAATGEALVVDPNRDVDQYLAAAADEGLRITHVTETHIHADFVSGALELADRTGAGLYLSDEGDSAWKYDFAVARRAVLLRDGDRLKVGNVRIDVIHTPGHTPEHLCFAVTDTAAADLPMGVFTGDFVFVGDVGRPDLLEKAAKFEGTMEQGARVLFARLRKFVAAYPDFIQLWPGHGAGSACGKSLGAVPQTTLGYEKRFNWGLSIDDEQRFVDAVLAGQPDPPMYFAEMKRINKQGPRVLGGWPRPQRLTEDRLGELLAGGAPVVDTRAGAAYAAGHARGSISVPAGRSFTTWAGSVVPFGREFYLIVDDASGTAVGELVRDLAMIGLDRVGGWFDAETLRAWLERNGSEVVPEYPAERLAQVLETDRVAVLDVRNGSEWEAGHIPGSHNFPLGRLAESLELVPKDRPLVVHCQAGSRALVAIGVLRANGFDDVHHLSGDFAAWSSDERPVARGPELAAAG